VVGLNKYFIKNLHANKICIMNVGIRLVKVKIKPGYNSMCVRTQFNCVHTHWNNTDCGADGFILKPTGCKKLPLENVAQIPGG
jgi:hypothetical protein